LSTPVARRSLEVHRDGFVCEVLKTEKVNYRRRSGLVKRLLERRRELTFVADAEWEQNLEHLSDSSGS